MPALLVTAIALAWLALAGHAGAEKSSKGEAIAQTSSNAPACGPEWITQTAVPQYAVLNGVAAVSANDRWAVGSVDTGTLTEHWDGSTWSVVTSPNVGSDSNGFFAVAALSANDIWAVGIHSTTTTGSQTLTEHWDGSQWSVIPSPDVTPYNNSLFGVAIVSTNDAWAVGGYDTTSNGPGQTLIEHWNGASWSVATSPNVGTHDNRLNAVAAVAANDVWAVGNYRDSNTSYTLVEHWNGTAWSVATSPNVGTASSLSSVTVVSANDIWAVGNSGINTTSTLTEHWDGIGWSLVTSPNVGVAQNLLQGVTAAAPNDVWAVGEYASSYSFAETLIEHWNGSAWSVVSSPSPGSLESNLIAVDAFSANDVLAIGYYTGSGSPGQPLIERYNPCASTPTPGASPTACAVQFTDVPQGSTFYSFVRCLACMGLINGYPDGTFRPNANVTRGQLSKIVSNAAGFSNNQTTQMFQDVAVGSTFFQYIGRLASRGFISGYLCGNPEPCVPPDNLPYFRPNSQASRGQISKIVSNAAGFNDNPTGQQFQDVLPGSTYYTYTFRLVSRSVMSGYPCGTAPAGPCLPPDNWPYFVPNNNATRGQTSKIVSNTFFPSCNPPLH
jgi:hypothetical protein